MSGIKVTFQGEDLTRWKKAMGSISSSFRAGVKAGILDNATNDDGDVIAEYAAYNEFGTAKIPSRPFMRTTVKNKAHNWTSLFMRVISGKVVSDASVIKRAFSLMGRTMQMDIKETIMGNMPPPNNPVYAALKQKEGGGYSGTLFNTGAMYKAINFELTDEKGTK